MNSKYVALITVIFFISCYTGYVWAEKNYEVARDYFEKFFSELSFIIDLPSYAIFAIIFLNNSVKAFLAMISGFLFGIIPVLFIFINGYVIGMIVYVKGVELGFDRTLIMLIPHGITEISAIIIACSYGVWLGISLYDRIRGGEVDLGVDKTSKNSYFKKRS